jgi:hypothetical protein
MLLLQAFAIKRKSICTVRVSLAIPKCWMVYSALASFRFTAPSL